MSYWGLPWRDALPDGVYERLVDDGLARALDAVEASGRHVARSRKVADELFATHVARAVHDAVLLTFQQLGSEEDGKKKRGKRK